MNREQCAKDMMCAIVEEQTGIPRDVVCSIILGLALFDDRDYKESLQKTIFRPYPSLLKTCCNVDAAIARIKEIAPSLALVASPFPMDAVRSPVVNKDKTGDQAPSITHYTLALGGDQNITYMVRLQVMCSQCSWILRASVNAYNQNSCTTGFTTDWLLDETLYESHTQYARYMVPRAPYDAYGPPTTPIPATLKPVRSVP